MAITYPTFAEEARRLGVATVIWDGPPRGIADLDEFERLVTESADAFVATHFSFPITPQIPVVQVVHDLIYLTHPYWQPTMADLMLRHDPVYLDGLVEVVVPKLKRMAAELPGAWRTLPPNEADVAVGELYTYTFSAAIARASATVAVSEFVADEVREQYPSRAPLAVIPPVRPSACRAYPASRRTRPQVLYVANFEPRKNHQLLFDAFGLEVMSAFDLVLVGRPHFASHHENFLRALTTARKGATIQVRANLTDASLTDLYGESTVFAFPSVAEGFGLPLLEALAAGLPIVTLDTVYARHVCEQHAELVARHDVDGFARALVHAASPSRDDIETILAAREATLARFEIGFVADALLRVLRQIGVVGR